MADLPTMLSIALAGVAAYGLWAYVIWPRIDAALGGRQDVGAHGWPNRDIL